MTKQNRARRRLVADLDRAVSEAVQFFKATDETLFDGHQTAREVLSHLVFWHREYLATASAFLEKRKPRLLRGSFAALNEKATLEFQDTPMTDLCEQLSQLQTALAGVLNSLTDWDRNFPVKRGCRFQSVFYRLPAFAGHIDAHVARLERAERHGEDWIRAYYREVTT